MLDKSPLANISESRVPIPGYLITSEYRGGLLKALSSVAVADSETQSTASLGLLDRGDLKVC